MSLLMPVKLSMYGGMTQSGLTSVLHSSITTPSRNRTTPISMIRWWAALPPVVSKSTNTRSVGSARTSGASIEGQQRIIEVGAAIAKDAPGLPVAAHGVEIELGGEDRLTAAVRLGDLLAGMRGDERGAVESHRIMRAFLD